MMVALRPFLLLLTFTCILNITQTSSNHERKDYIVYMGSLPRDLEANSLPSLHMSMAQRVLGRDFARDAVIHSYHKSFNGFVVKLTEAEAARMRGLESVISVFESKMHPVATVRSWNFIGFPINVSRQTHKDGHGFNESDVVVAVIDSGIWPLAETFNVNDSDYQMSEKLRKKWREEEQCPTGFTCNNKIVGAKSIRNCKVLDRNSVRPDDETGHGTHVASIIAGREIEANGSIINLKGFRNKTARGGVPWARIAVYKVCWPNNGGLGCKDEDILAAFDEAIRDEVHIISVSVGQKRTDIDCGKEYFNNSYAIGAFHAMQKNILTSLAANNLGPNPYTMTTYAPWLLSVAATTIGRSFITNITVKGHEAFKGESINIFPTNRYRWLSECQAPQSSPTIHLCRKDEDVRSEMKGEGFVIESDELPEFATMYAARATVLSEGDFKRILKYEHRGLAQIKQTEVEELGEEEAPPSVASISSRGPNPISPNILKPDIAAPGVHILAAWPPSYPIVSGNERKEHYNVKTGTSMACPHATAAAAYVKSFHPHWSPAAIKSALMTTAAVMNASLSDGAEFAYGSGQINPTRAINPGLVYDAGVEDYTNFLCAEGYDSEKIQHLNKDKKGCEEDDKKNGRVQDLNLPSFALSVDCSEEKKECPVNGTFHRIVTNVGQENSIYNVSIKNGTLNITVDPVCLSFEKKGEQKPFVLNITGNLKITDGPEASASSLWKETVSASLTWIQVESCENPGAVKDGYEVRSPIVVYNGNRSPKRKCRTASQPIIREGINEFEGKVNAALVA